MANFLDNFVDTDGTQLVAHTSDSGPGWTGSTALVITDDQVRNTVSGGQIATVDGLTVDDDGTDSYDVAFVPYFYSNSQNVGIVFNYADASNFDYVRIAGSAVDLFQVVAGSFNLVISNSYGSIPGAPQVMSEIKVEVRPTTLQVFYGGAALHTAQSATSNARSGGIGIRGFNSAGLVGWRVESMTCTNATFAAGGPTLSSVPATAYPGQSRTVTGTGFGAAQGTGGLTIGGVSQTITSWADTSITFTTVQGNNKYEAGKTLEVTTDAATTVSDTIELVADTANGFGYVDMSSPNTTDESSVAFNTTPTVVTGDQFEWEDFNNLGNLTIDVEGFVTNVDAEGTFRGRFWDATDQTWGAVEAIEVAEGGDLWPYGKGINPAAPQTWTWGRRHPKTNMRVRIYK